MPDLSAFNDAAHETLRPELLALTASPAWADALLANRPFVDLDRLLATSDDVIGGLPETEVDAALAGHPRIGERAAGHDETSVARSAQEQAGMAQADAGLRAAMVRANAAYEERFGRIYLVAAAGRGAEELLALLQQRLGNDPQTELGVVRSELARITRLRLQGSWGDR